MSTDTEMVFVSGLVIFGLGTAFSNGRDAGPTALKVHNVFAVLLVGWLAVWALIAIGSRFSSSNCETEWDGHSNRTFCDR